jgi:PA14 domain
MASENGEFFPVEPCRSRQGRRSGNKDDRIIDRVDPTVQFDFGVNLPDACKGIGHRFAIRWEGSVLAPETGDYEFIVRTEHSARLWVNDPKKPLIYRWVKSVNDTEFRESIRLLGGRVYPIRLEFSKGKQGEKDGKKDPDPPPSQTVSVKNSSSSAWNTAGSLMYGAWLPFGMTTFRPVFTEPISRSACV